MNSHAPFTITHHGSESEWWESPVLRSLIDKTVVIHTSDSNRFDGEIRSINEDGTIALTNSTVGNPWKEITIDLSQINEIHYC